MTTKRILTIVTLATMILALVYVNAAAQSGIARQGRPTATMPPTAPPVPTQTPDTGNLYGDLYVILRDENGLPILAENGCIQPISLVDGSVSYETINGTQTLVVIAGEPFALLSYIDPAGDLVECELTDEMSTWVQGVDFGRLNLGRAPDSVIAHAFDEAINKMNLATEFALDPSGRIMMLIDGEWFTIDAPAENLAIYIKMMLDGHWITLDTTPIEPGGKDGGGGGGPPPGDGPSTEPRPVLSGDAIALLGQIGYANLGDVNNVLNNHDLLLAASLLAGAADKSGTITLDKVIYINSIYGINQTGDLVDARGVRYFDFSNRDNGLPYFQDREYTYSSQREMDGCSEAGFIWVLQPIATDTWQATCMNILESVHFTIMVEQYWTTKTDAEGNPVLDEYDFIDNVRGFAQSADDALQVLEYIHNYKVPVDLYGE